LIQLHHLTEVRDNGRVCILGVVARVKEQRRRAGSPRIRIADSPHRDADTAIDAEASIDHGRVVARGGTCNVQLGDGDFLDASGSESRQRAGDSASATRGQVRLGAYNTRLAKSAYFVDEGAHSPIP
jgi:hypothetical protein